MITKQEKQMRCVINVYKEYKSNFLAILLVRDDGLRSNLECRLQVLYRTAMYQHGEAAAFIAHPRQTLAAMRADLMEEMLTTEGASWREEPSEGRPYTAFDVDNLDIPKFVEMMQEDFIIEEKQV